MKMPKERSAGVVVLRWSEMGWQFLALETGMRWEDGSPRMDFPKGHLDGDEDWLEAAIRETEEESGIEEKDLAFTWGLRYHDCVRPGKVCRMFIASTSATPRIRPNPVSKKREHQGSRWLVLEDETSEQRLHPYLRSGILWARTIVTKSALDSGHEKMLRPVRGGKSS
jgi:8-oxo-dGTP pyrophosphatase MutT (NUDIX family)